MTAKPAQSDVLNDEIAKLAERLGRKELALLETGSIHSAQESHRIKDGWSTLTFAKYVKLNGGISTSVSPDTSPAAEVLIREKVAGHAVLVESDPLAYLDNLVTVRKPLDLVLLGSASGTEHTLREWERAVQLVGSPGVILIDDVQHDEETCGAPEVIGQLVRNRVGFRGLKRWSGSVWIGMAAIDF